LRASAATDAISWLLAGCEEEGDTSASDDHIVLALSGQVSGCPVVVAGLAVAGDACIATASSVPLLNAFLLLPLRLAGFVVSSVGS
jgi:hypothetical protein